MRGSSGRAALLVCAAVWTALVGCAATQGSRFYLLSALPQETEPQVGRRMTVRLAVVEFPGYLDRPQMVTRSGENRLKLAEFDRWAEPLNHNFARVLAENLSTLLAPDGIAVLPWQSSGDADYEVKVEVTRFDGEPGGQAVLHVRWAILSDHGLRVHDIRKLSYAQAVQGPDYEDLAATASEMLANYSRDLAATLKNRTP